MKHGITRVLLLAAIVVMSPACGRPPARSAVAVIDLAVVAKATGHDEVLDRQAESARRQLETQLTQIAGDLEQRLQDEQKRLGGAEAAARRPEFQELTAQARQQLAQSQAAAQQRAQEFQFELVRQYRQALQPLAIEVARGRGAGVILVVDPSMLWFEADTDITADVIAAIRAKGIELPGVDAASGGEATPAETSAGP